MQQIETIYIEGITFHGFHGVLDDEKRDGRRYSVDVQVSVDVIAACTSDDLNDTVDYRRLAEVILRLGTEKRFNLLEAMAHAMADALEALCPITHLKIKVRKHQPGLPGHPESVAIGVERKGTGQPRY